MEWQGLFVASHPDVYEPSHDTFLLAAAVAERVRVGDRVLEVGCGTGLVAMAAARAGGAVVATDANPHAVGLAVHNARQNQLRIEAREGDLLAGLAGPFDLVCFNPPYLPTAPGDVVAGPLNLAFDGGADGNAVVLRFASAVAALRPSPREVLVVHSSLSDPAALDARMAEGGFAGVVVATERHFYETLTVRRYAPR